MELAQSHPHQQLKRPDPDVLCRGLRIQKKKIFRPLLHSDKSKIKIKTKNNVRIRTAYRNRKLADSEKSFRRTISLAQFKRLKCVRKTVTKSLVGRRHHSI